MFKNHKKIFMSFFFLAMVVGLSIFIENFRTPTIAIGRTVPAQERPGMWKKIMADSINAKGINLVVDGKKINTTVNTVIMSEQMDILLPSQLVTATLNCAYNEYQDGKVLLQKGNTRVETQPDLDYIIVDGNMVDMDNPCMVAKDTMYLRANILAKGFGYEYRWDIAENTLYLTDVNYGESLLPSRYSYVDIDKIATVKNQGDLSICWATASIAAIETSLLPKQDYFLSPEHMAFTNGNAATVNVGGEYTRALAYLAAWLGPITNDSAYINGKLNLQADPVKHVQEAQILEAKNYEAIKRAVFLYGGVQTSMYTSMYTAAGSSVYYNRQTASYCYIGTQKANHAIVIVGWDDNYSKENFNTELEGDGAFICMNSWGTQFGDNGIFYVSYYDSNIGKSNVVYTSIEDTDNYDNIYQSDLAGWVGQLGYDGDTAYFANCYTACGNELLKAVSFYATGRNTEYEIYFVDNFVNITSFGRKKFIQKGKFTNAGYYTVDLEQPISLEKDKKYAVVIKIKTPDSLHPIAVEHRAGASTSEAVINDGEGYISLGGSSWEHIEASKSCNVCLKMFTDNDIGENNG